MKLIKKLLPLVLWCILITACNALWDEPIVTEQDGMVLVHIGFSDMSARSVMPNMPSEESIAFFYLYGTSSTDTDAQEVLLGKFNGDLDKASVLLRPGRWNFTLEARDDNDYPVLKGVRKGVDISVGYSATVHFSLLLIDDPYYEGTASIVIELSDVTNVDTVKTVIDGVTLEPPLEIESGVIHFYNIMPAGDYLVHFFLKDGEGRALAVITEMLVIRSGLASEKIITLTADDFDNPPASPGNFRVTAYTDGNLVFAWERNSWNETGFVLNDGTADYIIDAGHTSYTLADSAPIGKKFTFYAVNDFGESSKLEYRIELPGTPAGVTAQALSPNSIEVFWQAADGAETYTVQRAENSNGPYIVIDTLFDTVFIDNGLSFSTVYHYRVMANNMFGSSSVSYAVSAETMPLFGSEDNPFFLTENVWADGAIETEGGAQWFMFIATSGTPFIHVEFGALNDLYVQVYNNTGNAIGNETRLSGNTRSFSLTLTGGQQYYIRVRPYSTAGSGAYRIGYNTSTVPPAIVLTESVWAGGYIIPAVGEQWFTFTATAAEQYIHVEFGTLTDLYVRVYNSGNAVGSETRLTGGTMSVSRSLTAGQQYSIRVRPYSSGGSGAYKIAFNASIVPPGVTVTTLTANIWADGTIATANGTQWFMFTATAATQFINVEFGALAAAYLQVYENSGTAAGNEITLSRVATSVNCTLSIGQRYYIRVRPNSGSGSYRIVFNSSFAPPNVTALIANNWTNGNIAANGAQWFRFTATAAEQYIHVEFGTLRDMYVCVYDNNGVIVTRASGIGGIESEKRLRSDTTSLSRSLTVGQQYYVQVWPYSAAGNSGTYRITFNASIVPPGAVVLTANTWADGYIAEGGGSRWFTFTATAATQYIHVANIAIWPRVSVQVQVYDNSGNAVGSEGSLSNMFLSRSVTTGQQYYVRVQNWNSEISFKIAFNTTPAPPGTIALTANTWANGNIEEGGAQWFRFTATAATQYIHVESGTLSIDGIRVYNNSGNEVNNQIIGRGISLTLTNGQQYYIRVQPNSGSHTYKIAFNTSIVPPVTVTALTANTWANGNIPSVGAEQWFRFTATAGTHYIHFDFSGTLLGSIHMGYINVVVYDSSTNAGVDTNYNDGLSMSCSVTSGRQYYIRVWVNSGYGPDGFGTYRITFNASATPPP